MKNIIHYLLLPIILVYASLSASMGLQSALEASQTPLMQAAAGDNLEKLIKELDRSEVKINEQDSQGRTALFIAAQEGKADNVKELLKRKADIDLIDKDGMTPLQVAVTSQDPDTVNALLDACDQVNGKCKNIEQRDKKLGFTPLARAFRSGKGEIIRLLLDAGANMSAQVKIKDKNIDIVELYPRDHKEIADIIEKEKNKERGIAFMKAVMAGDPDNAKKLLAQGIDVNSKAYFYGSPLTWAAKRGYSDLVDLLIKAGADVNAKEWYKGETALMWAVHGGNINTVETLVKNNADIFAQNKYGKTALDVISYYLLPDNTERKPDHLAILNYLLKVILSNLKQIDKENRSSAFIVALHNQKPDVAKRILENGIDVNKSSSGDIPSNVPLLEAASYGDKEMVSFLINSGADVNIRSETSHRSPLHQAAIYGRKDIVQLLIENKANINAIDAIGYTPLRYAMERVSLKPVYKEIVNLLYQAGAT